MTTRRLRIRLRTILIAVALVALPMAYVAETWRRGGFAFQEEQAKLAHSYWYKCVWYKRDAMWYDEHTAPGHKCFACRNYRSQASEMAAEQWRLYHEAHRKFLHHARRAGPAYDGRTGTIRDPDYDSRKAAG